MDWVPTLEDRPGPLYQRIVDALSADVASGRLRRGQQLPTHRALAKALGIDLTTVTRAYAEARQRGLTEARVGQGTFVAETMMRQADAPPPAFDLTMNLPPQPLAADLEGRLTRAIAAIEREAGFSAYLNYRDPAGTREERDTAAAWLATRVTGAHGDRLVIAPGTQNAILNFLMSQVRSGGVVLAEALTYPGLKDAAAYAGVRIAGVATDASGILPDALAEATRRHGAKAVYLIPTIHNPTAVTMPLARRKAVAEVIRANGLTLFEDDAYGALAPEAVPLATLIPERTYFAASLSKCIAPGLRVSFLLTPSRAAANAMANAVRASTQMPVALIVAVVTRWLRDGSGEAIVAAVRREAAERQALAAQALAQHVYSSQPYGHHVWVNLPRAWSRAEFAAHVQRQGLAVVTSEAFWVGETGEPPHAIRVALGAARSRADLARALDILAGALKSSAVTARVV
jgi:DNA-binding transcriptional MocR family regulator